VNSSGISYLIPIDADVTSSAQSANKGLRLNEVIENFMPGKIKIAFLDVSLTPVSVSGVGVAGEAEKSMHTDRPREKAVLISYASNSVVLEKDNRSIYTQALLEHLADPQDIGVVLSKVRDKVMRATAGEQRPWAVSSLIEKDLVLSAIKAR
jgi:uncharacterized caspase-like protein